jgi:hypothetical protein
MTYYPPDYAARFDPTFCDRFHRTHEQNARDRDARAAACDAQQDRSGARFERQLAAEARQSAAAWRSLADAERAP